MFTVQVKFIKWDKMNKQNLSFKKLTGLKKEKKIPYCIEIFET